MSEVVVPFETPRQMHERIARRAAELPEDELKHGGGGGTSGGMETVDAKIAASEARTDTKFAELRGDLKDFATKGTVWQAAATIIAVILAAIAFGGDRFDAGIGMADVAQNQIQRDAEQDQAVKRMEAKLDQLLERKADDAAK